MNVYKCIILVSCKFNYPSLFKMFYAVRTGRKPGVYTSWPECELQVKGYPKPRYKKFSTEEEAWEFINGEASPISPTSNSKATSSHNTNYTSTPTKVPQAESVAMPESDAFCESLNSVKFTAKTIENQMERITSTFGVLCKQIEHLENVAQGLNCRTFSTSTSSGFVEQFSSPGAGMKANSSLKRSYTEGPYPVKNKTTPMLKKHKTTDDEENWTGHPFNESEGTAVYTDGACIANGMNGAMAGIGVYWGPGSENNVSERLTGRPTNNRAEIHAAIKAVEQAKQMGIKNLLLYTDSQFLINSITKWIKGWKKNGWVLTTGKPVINRKDFEQLDAALKMMNIKWIYVPGHKGNKGNEEADTLATTGARKSLPNSTFF